MPRVRQDITEGKTLEENCLNNHLGELLTLVKLGIVYLEMLDDVQRNSETYHVVGANRPRSSYLVTTSVGDEKFRAHGATVGDLVISLLEQYNWSDNKAEETLQRLLKLSNSKKGI